VPAGAWLAWQVIAIIAAGMFFHRCTLGARGRRQNPCGDAAPAVVGPASCSRPSPRRSPASASATSSRWPPCAGSGLGGLPALVLGLYSQSLVPWGALATGTTVGATLAGLAPNALGLGSALLQMPIHAFYLLLYWRFARQAGVAVPSRRRSTTQPGPRCCWR
jgi:lactate permease